MASRKRLHPIVETGLGLLKEVGGRALASAVGSVRKDVARAGEAVQESAQELQDEILSKLVGAAFDSEAEDERPRTREGRKPRATRKKAVPNVIDAEVVCNHCYGPVDAGETICARCKGG